MKRLHLTPSSMPRRRSNAPGSWTFALLSAVLTSTASLPVAADVFADAAVGALYDTNLTEAQAPADVRADAAATLAGSVGKYQALTGNDGLTLALNANADLYSRFHGLNDVALGGSIDFKHKFGLGMAAPWISLAATIGYDDFSGSIRDGAPLAVTAAFGKRVTENFAASLGIIYDRRYATNDVPVVPTISGRVFATSGGTAFARASYDFTETLQISARFSVRRGDVVSTTRPNLPIFLASDAIAADPTFGPDFFAYRLRGTTGTAAATMSWALSQQSSLNLGYVGARTRATQGLDYRSGTTNITLAYQY
jgi:hypothetical protein